jgi:hypothetical protein
VLRALARPTPQKSPGVCTWAKRPVSLQSTASRKVMICSGLVNATPKISAGRHGDLGSVHSPRKGPRWRRHDNIRTRPLDAPQPRPMVCRPRWTRRQLTPVRRARLGGKDRRDVTAAADAMRESRQRRTEALSMGIASRLIILGDLPALTGFLHAVT